MVAERTGRGVAFVVMINVVRDRHVMGDNWERICRRRGKFWGWGMGMRGVRGMWLAAEEDCFVGGMMMMMMMMMGAYRKLPFAPIE